MNISSTDPQRSQAVTDKWRSNRRLARMWDRGAKNVPLAVVYGVILFGTDNRRFFRDMDRIGELPEGAAVLDLPSGGGVLLRSVWPEQRLRYVAADVSPLMLERVRAEAARRGLHDVETVETYAEDLPFDDDSFDVVATYNGLHCVTDPPRALSEMRRVLRPGGELRGSVLVRGVGRRQDAFIELWQRRALFDVVVTEAEFSQWLRDAGFERLDIQRSGAQRFFSGRVAVPDGAADPA